MPQHEFCAFCGAALAGHTIKVPALSERPERTLSVGPLSVKWRHPHDDDDDDDDEPVFDTNLWLGDLIDQADVPDVDT